MTSYGIQSSYTRCPKWAKMGFLVHFSIKNDVQKGTQNDENSLIAENVVFATPTTYNQGFYSPKGLHFGHKKWWKKWCKKRPPQKPSFQGPTRAPKGKRERKGFQNDAFGCPGEGQNWTFFWPWTCLGADVAPRVPPDLKNHEKLYYFRPKTHFSS